MKKLIWLSALAITITALIFQSTSYTTANVKSNANLSVVPTEVALIAINYLNDQQFEITNNKEKIIVIESITITETNQKIIGDKDEKDTIHPGNLKTYTYPTDAKGKTIKINTYWNGGSAEIHSTIPE